jgi:hypothetical protein
MLATLEQDAATPQVHAKQARPREAPPRATQLKLFAAIILAIILAAYVATGLRYAAYSPHRSGAYLWCVYHVHSNLSDGLQSPQEIARQARAAGVSLVLLTDHGRPNVASSIFRDTIDGVTIVGGSEATLPDGHFTFFGASQAPGFRVSSFPPDAMQDARSWGAFPVLAYPDDRRYGWHYWNADLHPGGIEILNLFTSLRRTTLVQRLQLALFYPFSHYYFLKTISFPSESIAHWDEFLQHDRTWGFLASDAHGGFHITKFLPIKLPSYADTFSFVAMGIDKRYDRDPEAAVRKGDFFNCIRGAAEPDNFEFFAQKATQQFRPGSDAPQNSDLHITAQLIGQAIRLVLKKNGATFSEATADHLDLQNAPPGVYRVEAYLLHHPLLRPDVPWIISNPIFVGVTRESAQPARIATHTAHATQPKSSESHKR